MQLYNIQVSVNNDDDHNKIIIKKTIDSAASRQNKESRA